jgi:hypothetical protein
MKPGIYVARAVSDVFGKTGHEFYRLSEVPRSSLDENRGVVKPRGVENEDREGSKKKGESQGAPEEKGDVRVVITPGSPGYQDGTEGREPYYCIIEMIHTSASPVELGKYVRIGDWEPLDGVCAG